MTKYCPTTLWIQGSERVNVVNNTEGLTQGSCTVRKSKPQRCVYAYVKHICRHKHTQIHMDVTEQERYLTALVQIKTD